MSRCARCRTRTGDPGEGQRGQELEVVRPGGDEHLYLQQLEDGTARPRPQTPAYPAITTAFGTAVREIFAGRPVKPALDAAARRVEKDLEAYQGYPAPEP